MVLPGMCFTVNEVSFVSGIDLAGFNQMSGGFKYLEGGRFRQRLHLAVEAKSAFAECAVESSEK